MPCYPDNIYDGIYKACLLESIGMKFGHKFALPIVIILGVICFHSFAINNDLEFGDDGIAYVLLARSISSGMGYQSICDHCPGATYTFPVFVSLDSFIFHTILRM